MGYGYDPYELLTYLILCFTDQQFKLHSSNLKSIPSFLHPDFISPMSDFVSEDVVRLILKRLPVKALLRRRIVCKGWKQIIDSDSFTLEHLAFQKPRFIAEYEVPDQFLVLDPRTLPSVETLTGPIDRGNSCLRLRLLGTLHGVVCLFDDRSKYLIWNPAIHSFLTLPGYRDAKFGWDDSEDIDTFGGFWIDPSTKDFKILIFKLVVEYDGIYDKENPPDGVLYSSSTREWISIPLGELWNCKPRPHQYAPPVMLGDVAYWRAEHEWIDEEDEEHLDLVLLSFDFVKESFEIVDVPYMKYSGLYQPVHCKLQDMLTLVYWDAKDPYRCDVYSRREDTWVKMFGFKSLPRFIYHVTWVLEKTQERCRALALTSDREGLILFDTRDGCFELDLEFALFEPEKIYLAYDFVESLLFP